MKGTLTAVLVLVCLGHLSKGQRPGWQPRYLGEANLRHAAFIDAHYTDDESLAYEDRWSMYISTFDAGMIGRYDDKYYMRSIGRYLDDISTWDAQIQLLDTNAYWPNAPDRVPREVAGADGIIWSSGFLVPSKTDGQLQMYDTTQEPPAGPFNIASTDQGEWSYHRVRWVDMDADGDLDALTCRFYIPSGADPVGNIVYYENTGTGFSEGWPEHIFPDIYGDVSFAVTTLISGGRSYMVIFLAQFFQKKLSIVWTENEANDWSDLSMIQSRVIDATPLQPFDVIIDDFNQDGTIEMMVSQYNNTAGEGRAAVYFIPEDFRVGEFTSQVVADGFVPLGAGEVMSPGHFITYYPSDAYANEVAADGRPHKLWIMLSGDDDGSMYILYPDTEDRNDWTYQKQELVKSGGNVMGAMTLGDFDGDGYTDVVCAAYSVGTLFVFTYAP